MADTAAQVAAQAQTDLDAYVAAVNTSFSDYQAAIAAAQANAASAAEADDASAATILQNMDAEIKTATTAANATIAALTPPVVPVAPPAPVDTPPAPTVTVTIAPTTLLNGVVNDAGYNAPLAASGGTAPYTYAVSAGSLPDGLTLSTDGVISGTPSTAGTDSFTVTATDSTGATGPQDYSLQIDAASS